MLKKSTRLGLPVVGIMKIEEREQREEKVVGTLFFLYRKIVLLLICLLCNNPSLSTKTFSSTHHY